MISVSPVKQFGRTDPRLYPYVVAVSLVIHRLLPPYATFIQFLSSADGAVVLGIYVSAMILHSPHNLKNAGVSN